MSKKENEMSNTNGGIGIKNDSLETVTISKKEYESLLEDSEFLSALQGAGVDNWDGYDYAIELMNEE
jgi:hypothetical protein